LDADHPEYGVLIPCRFTDYRIELPWPGAWQLELNSDRFDRNPDPEAAGSDGTVQADGPPGTVYGQTARLTIPANSAVAYRIGTVLTFVNDGSAGAITIAITTDTLVLAGGNVCAVKNSDGQWEVLQFASAELIAANQYKLTRLLRGQLGSEYTMCDPVSVGAIFVMLDTAVVQSGIAVTERHNPWSWKWGPSTKTIDDPTYQVTSFSFDGVGLRPYSPVQLKGVLNTSTNDWTLTWIRRTRIDGDNWEAPDVPLGEEIESYDVEISGGDVVRTVTVSSPSFTYAAAMQVDDFGTTQSSIQFRVYQNSLAYGRGSVATATITGDTRI
jgi:hypothetical protein